MTTKDKTFTDIYEELQWQKNVDERSRNIAGTIMRFSSDEFWVDNHNDAIRDAIRETNKATIRGIVELMLKDTELKCSDCGNYDITGAESIINNIKTMFKDEPLLEERA